MKKFFSSLRLFALAGISTAVFLTSCDKDDDDFDDNNDNNVAAGLMAFNLASEQSSVGFRIGGNTLTQFPLGYNNYTGVYLPIFPGNRTVDAFSGISGNTLASASGNFETGKFYSVFLVGTGASLENVIIHDNFDGMTANGKAYIRYINAISDASNPTVTISSGATTVVNTSASYKSVSGFVTVDPGAVVVSVNNGGSINATRTITLEANKVYTVLLIGKPGGTGAEAVQIKYVANGQVNETSRMGTTGALSTGN